MLNTCWIKHSILRNHCLVNFYTFNGIYSLFDSASPHRHYIRSPHLLSCLTLQVFQRLPLLYDYLIIVVVVIIIIIYFYLISEGDPLMSLLCLVTLVCPFLFVFLTILVLCILKLCHLRHKGLHGLVGGDKLAFIKQASLLCLILFCLKFFFPLILFLCLISLIALCYIYMFIF